MTVNVATPWRTNADLIVDVAKLGYLDGTVLDTTYGLGIFWQRFKPKWLYACSLRQGLGHIHADFTHLPFSDRLFDVVVLDPPYKLNGTPSVPDERYGVHIPARWQDRMTLIMDGVEESCRVARKHVLVKCMDQVVSGAKRWQTIEVTRVAEGCGWKLVDRFDMLSTPRPQPGDRRQVHAASNYSTLLVFG